MCVCVIVHMLLAKEAISIMASPVVTLSISDCELLPERNEFGGDGLTVAEQV